MEMLNKVELIGIVGAVDVKQVADTMVANFSMATNISYNDNGGNVFIETTWFSVAAVGSSLKVNDIDKLQHGLPVRVIGRLRTNKDGYSAQVVAHHLESLAGKFHEYDSLQPEKV